MAVHSHLYSISEIEDMEPKKKKDRKKQQQQQQQRQNRRSKWKTKNRRVQRQMSFSFHMHTTWRWLFNLSLKWYDHWLSKMTTLNENENVEWVSDLIYSNNLIIRSDKWAWVRQWEVFKSREKIKTTKIIIWMLINFIRYDTQYQICVFVVVLAQYPSKKQQQQ